MNSSLMHMLAFRPQRCLDAGTAPCCTATLATRESRARPGTSTPHAAVSGSESAPPRRAQNVARSSVALTARWITTHPGRGTAQHGDKCEQVAHTHDDPWRDKSPACSATHPGWGSHTAHTVALHEAWCRYLGCVHAQHRIKSRPMCAWHRRSRCAAHCQLASPRLGP